MSLANFSSDTRLPAFDISWLRPRSENPPLPHEGWLCPTGLILIVFKAPQSNNRGRTILEGNPKESSFSQEKLGNSDAGQR